MIKKQYDKNKLQHVELCQRLGAWLLKLGNREKVLEVYDIMLELVYNNRESDISGKHFLSQQGLNVEAQEFIPSVRRRRKRKYRNNRQRQQHTV